MKKAPPFGGAFSQLVGELIPCSELVPLDLLQVVH